MSSRRAICAPAISDYDGRLRHDREGRVLQQNPGTDVAVTQMIRKTTDKSRGVRLGNFVQIRTIVDEEMEGVWAGKKSAKEALDTAVKRGNEQLERFEKANKT